MVTLLFVYIPYEPHYGALCSSSVVSLRWSHALSELSMGKLLPVLTVLLEEKWLDHFEYARILVASCRREDAQRTERWWRDYFAAAAKAYDDERIRADAASGRNHENTASCQCGKCRWFLEDTTLVQIITQHSSTE